MQIKISARHGQLSEATREKISAKVSKLARYFERLTAIEVTVNLEHADAPSDLQVVGSDGPRIAVGAEVFAGVEAETNGVAQCADLFPFV